MKTFNYTNNRSLHCKKKQWAWKGVEIMSRTKLLVDWDDHSRLDLRVRYINSDLKMSLIRVDKTLDRQKTLTIVYLQSQEFSLSFYKTLNPILLFILLHWRQGIYQNALHWKANFLIPEDRFKSETSNRNKLPIFKTLTRLSD